MCRDHARRDPDQQIVKVGITPAFAQSCSPETAKSPLSPEKSHVIQIKVIQIKVIQIKVIQIKVLRSGSDCNDRCCFASFRSIVQSH
jgi:hypothetical protein